CTWRRPTKAVTWAMRGRRSRRSRTSTRRSWGPSSRVCGRRAASGVSSSCRITRRRARSRRIRAIRCPSSSTSPATSSRRVGERVGTGQGPATDVALDAFEGAAICAAGGYNALSGIAIAEHGTFLRVPDTYMEKIACGPEGRGTVDLDRSPTANLRALADAKGVYVENLTVAILDRPRHNALIEEVRKSGARIKLIDSGDVSSALATTRPDAGIDILMGTGGAAQGILAAAALVCLGGEMQARLRPRNEH